MSWTYLFIFSALAGVYAGFGQIKAAVFCAFFAVCSSLLILSKLEVLSNLGTDSFQEAASFSSREAIFWLSTVFADLSQGSIFSRFFAGLATIATVTLILKAAQKKIPKALVFRRPPPVSLVTILGITGLLYSFNSTLQNVLNQSRAFEAVSANFSSGHVPIGPITSDTLTIFVYIGESLSAANMSAYGYPRNTTPNIDSFRKNDSNFLLFSNVFSTHTHTSQSLLEALSLGRSHENVLTPIAERPRLSVIDLLEKNGVRTALYSNQNMAGTTNQASSIIFRSSSHRQFSVNTALFGNRAAQYVARPWDHDFLIDVALRDQSFKDSGLSVLFFHSYAGHGPYRAFVPASYPAAPFWSLQKKSGEAVGGAINPLSIDDYDRAISYVDETVSKAIQFVKAQDKPIVFVFFSDHGDSVFTNRGHDSSRFIHEMARIPFLLYFNDAARKKYDKTFEKYRTYSLQARTSTLAQFSSTLLDLLGFSSPSLGESVRVQTPIGGSIARLDPILVRRVGDKVTYIDLADKHPNGQDGSTNHYILSKKSDSVFCYHRANSYAKFRRAQLVSRCIELDVVVNTNGEIAVHHPPVGDAGLRLNDLFSDGRVADVLWLDGKNIGRGTQCLQLLKVVERHLNQVGTLFVEFPTSGIAHLQELGTCMKRMVELGIRTSYYVSTENALSCSEAIRRSASASDEASCNTLSQEVASAVNSGLFTDLSFNFAGLPAVRSISAAKRLTWNTWNFPPHEIDGIKEGEFNLIILKNNDPNTR